MNYRVGPTFKTRLMIPYEYYLNPITNFRRILINNRNLT